MENSTKIADRGIVQQPRPFKLSTKPFWTTSTCTTTSAQPDNAPIIHEAAKCSAQKEDNDVSAMSLAEFVRHRFMPEFVEKKRSSGRAHFREILKFILRSDRALCDIPATLERTDVRRKAVYNWPYLDSLRLRDIDEDSVHQVTLIALKAGYSLQTATHIRNVVRAIYSYAITACSYKGANPAALVTLPTVAHTNERTLTLAEIEMMVPMMRYPERAMALLTLLTDMNLVEICGLQWKYVNLSSNRSPVEGDWIAAKTIAIRNQWYRGEFRPVTVSRSRSIPVTELLSSVLGDLKLRRRLTRPQDFVLASQSGNPVDPGNIAKRRLKSIGQSCGMPWLSWQVFSRTHVRLRSEFGRHFHRECASILRRHS